MVELPEKLISDLRRAVSDLEKDVEELKTLEPTNTSEFFNKAGTISELITQALLKVDSVQISKDAAADALRDGDRKTSRQIAVLLSRRKGVVKKLNEMGDCVDKLKAQAMAHPNPDATKEENEESDNTST